MRTEIPIDAAFIRRIYRTSIVVGALAAWSVYGPWGWTAVVGLTLGVALALGGYPALGVSAPIFPLLAAAIIWWSRPRAVLPRAAAR